MERHHHRHAGVPGSAERGGREERERVVEVRYIGADVLRKRSDLSTRPAVPDGVARQTEGSAFVDRVVVDRVPHDVVTEPLEKGDLAFEGLVFAAPLPVVLVDRQDLHRR